MHPRGILEVLQSKQGKPATHSLLPLIRHMHWAHLPLCTCLSRRKAQGSEFLLSNSSCLYGRNPCLKTHPCLSWSPMTLWSKPPFWISAILPCCPSIAQCSTVSSSSSEDVPGPPVTGNLWPPPQLSFLPLPGLAELPTNPCTMISGPVSLKYSAR